MAQHDVFSNSEPESGAAHFPCASFIHAIKPFKDARLRFQRDADARVFYIHDKFVIRYFCRDFNRAAVWRVFNRIIDEIHEYLHEELLVNVNLRQRFGRVPRQNHPGFL